MAISTDGGDEDGGDQNGGDQDGGDQDGGDQNSGDQDGGDQDGGGRKYEDTNMKSSDIKLDCWFDLYFVSLAQVPSSTLLLS